MPKSLEELKNLYDDTNKKISAGEHRLLNLFAEGVTVKHPLKNGQEVTFRNHEDERNFFAELKDSREFPLDEIGREGNCQDHMKLFLYSKGFSVQDVTELIMNPDSERTKAMEEKIRGFRQEYYDQVINKDTEKISRMYVDAFRNLKGQDMSWIGGIRTTEDYLEKMPMINSLLGVQSYWVQTNNLGEDLRPIDQKLISEIQEGMNREGIRYDRMVDTLQFIQSAHQFASSKIDNLNLPGMEPYHIDLALMIRSFGTLAGESKLEEMGMPIDMVRYGQLMANHNHIVGTDGPLGRVEENVELIKNTEDWIQGKDDAIPPVQIFETVDETQLAQRKNWGIRSTNPRKTPSGDDVRHPAWKPAMEEGFRNKELMDPGSVIHCINLAKKGEYDALTGVNGDGETMLQVMNGDLSGYDRLSDLSKAAAAGHLMMEHPELFIGSARHMQQSAERLKLDLDNPVYVSAMEGAAKLSAPVTAQKISELKENLAAKKLEAGMKSASVEEKKNFAKLLFLMQLGNAEPANSADGEGRQPSMLTGLAAGGQMKFRLPQMDEKDKTAFQFDFPEGRSRAADGMQQSVLYGTDDTMNIKLDGARGHADAQGGMEISLRGTDPGHLNRMLTGLKEKMASMSSDELDDLIAKLGGRSMNRSEVADMVRGFGIDKEGNEKQANARYSLIAKEIETVPDLGENDLIAIDRTYSMELAGERKYKAAEPVSTEEFEKALNAETVPEQKEFFTKYLDYYREQTRQMKMYADAAERMHRVREANENSAEPLAGVRAFAQKSEREMAAKFNEARNTVREMERGLKHYALKDPKVDKKNAGKAWVNCNIDRPELSRKVKENAGKQGLTTKELEAAMASGFAAVAEKSTFREQQGLNDNKWTLLGVKYGNSGKYQDILDSMENLKKMRSKEATPENVRAYYKEYMYLRDLCEDYIVSRRNPWTPDGKERKRMVTDVWEGMSNVTKQSFDQAFAGARPGAKIGDVNIHEGYRRSISLKDLEARETQRNENLKKERKERKAAAKQRAQEKDAHRKDEIVGRI